LDKWFNNDGIQTTAIIFRAGGARDSAAPPQDKNCDLH
jgi:hypothetical protein